MRYLFPMLGMQLIKPTPRVVVDEVARRVQGVLSGNGAGVVTGLSPFDFPQPNHLSFIKELTVKGIEKLAQPSQLAAIFLPLTEQDRAGLKSPTPLIFVADPYDAFVSLIPLFFEELAVERSVSTKADVHPTAKIGKNVSVGAFCSIGAGVTLDDDVVIFPHVTLYPHVSIGRGSIVHSGAILREGTTIGADSVVQNGAVIGADGFGYVPDPKLGLKSIPQVGSVELADRVDVGANACIDRATFGKTFVGLSSKIDNLVQIGHNVQIGQHSIVCGTTGIAGSCIIGNQVVIGGNVGISDHITIGDRVRLGGKSGVTGDILEPGDYVGYPAIKAQLWRRQAALIRRLPELFFKRAKKEENT